MVIAYMLVALIFSIMTFAVAVLLDLGPWVALVAAPFGGSAACLAVGALVAFGSRQNRSM